MKTTRLFLCLALAVCSAAPAAELLWQDFDSAPTGSVAALPGWSRASWLGGLTGRVFNVDASHPPFNTLELVWNVIGSSAVFTNFNSAFNPANEHPVIRCSAKLHCSNTNAFFQLGLRDSKTGNLLSFQSTNGYGCFGFIHRDKFFAPLVPDRFVDVTFFYNRSNNQYRCDFDFTNRLAWTTNDEGLATVTQFTQFVSTRLNDTVPTSGPLLIDDVSVETFPPYVWAWWRCSLEPGARFVEQLGSFKPAFRAGVANAEVPGSSDPVWDGAGDVHNAGALRQLQAGPAEAALPLPATTNWTFETAFRMSPAAADTTFFDWSTNLGHNATSAWIQIGYSTNGYIYANLRDSQQGDVTYVNLGLRYFFPNGRWQHLAVVKSNANLTLYVDYQFVTNRVLTSPADGSYAFSTAARATLGIALNSGNPVLADTSLDEIRFSGKALAPAEFLQPGQPLIVDIVDHPTNATWKLTLKGILGKSYRVETSPALDPDAARQFATNLVADYTFNYIYVPGTAPKTNFVRVVREN